ncbi:MAG: hypothetical protein IKO68_13305 [Oscillospiraceae bacterium]|nr:hypothetical protein [Oscillospiraceae bacterium]
MLPGYTHNAINLSETEGPGTLTRAKELFDPNRPDAFFVLWRLPLLPAPRLLRKGPHRSNTPGQRRLYGLLGEEWN